jgi:3-deoxy-D-manno-octulosonic-acid transferase
MKAKIFLYAYYTIGLFLSMIIAFCMFFHKRGRRRLAERFGLFTSDINTREELIWVHAASLGELKGLEPLLSKIPKTEKVLLTSVSITALDYAQNLPFFFQSFLLPFDHPLFINRIFKKYRFKIFIFAETEIWPSLLTILQKQRVPCLMLNAKILNASFYWYKLLLPLFSSIISKLALVCCANQVSLQRFRDLGVKNDCLILTGNMKYSFTSYTKTNLEYSYLFSAHRPTLVLGSIRKGEELFFLNALKDLKLKGQFWNIILAPRQLEDLPYFINFLNQNSYKYNLFTSKQVTMVQKQEHAFLLVDLIGHLAQLYTFADLVVIGGSLVPGYGGHNPIEAAVHAKPIILGVYNENLADIIGLDPDAFIIVKTEDQISKILLDYDFNNFAEYSKRSEKLQQLLSGANKIVFENVSKFIKLTED